MSYDITIPRILNGLVQSIALTKTRAGKDRISVSWDTKKCRVMQPTEVKGVVFSGSSINYDAASGTMELKVPESLRLIVVTPASTMDETIDINLDQIKAEQARLKKQQQREKVAQAKKALENAKSVFMKAEKEYQKALEDAS